MKVVCIVPARLESKRFFRKMLQILHDGKSLLQCSYEQAMTVKRFSSVIVATDHVEIAKHVEDFGGTALMTASTCQSGTERVIEVLLDGRVEADVFVNWQGDEPFIQESMIEELLQTIETDREKIWTLKKKIVNREEILSPHIVKVVTNHRDEALYFSRSPIPYHCDSQLISRHYKHIGLYAYTKKALYRLSTLAPCAIEKEENLEQLRFLYYGIPIEVHETTCDPIGVNTEQEFFLAKQCVAQSRG